MRGNLKKKVAERKAAHNIEKRNYFVKAERGVRL